jgi:hypothetical protein
MVRCGSDCRPGRSLDVLPDARKEVAIAAWLAVAELGAVLSRLHGLPVPDCLRLPEFNIFGRVAGRVAAARIPGADRSFLAGRLHALRAQYEDPGFALRRRPSMATHTKAT